MTVRREFNCSADLNSAMGPVPRAVLYSRKVAVIMVAWWAAAALTGPIARKAQKE